jgi:hypothetical protein
MHVNDMARNVAVKGGFMVHVDDVAGNISSEPGKYCSSTPRHRMMQLHSSLEGSQ